MLYHEKISKDALLNPMKYLRVTKKLLKLIDQIDYQIIYRLPEKVNEGK